MRVDLVLLDGAVVPAAEVGVTWDAPGFRQGYGLFETIRVAAGSAFLAGCHAQRISAAAPVMGMTPWMHPKTLARSIDRLVALSGIAEGAIRVFMMPGSPSPGEDPAAPGPALDGGLAEPWHPRIPSAPDGPPAAGPGEPPWAIGGGGRREVAPASGGWNRFAQHSLGRARYLATIAPGRPALPEAARALLAPDLRDPRGPLVGLKTISYAGERLLLAWAQSLGADEAIRRNTMGRICEGTRSNVFLIEGDRLVTPPLTEGLLAGITRWFLLRTASDCGLEPLEEPVSVERLLAAREAFLSSTLRGVVPLMTLDGRPLGNARPGPMTLRLKQALERHISKARNPL